MDPIEYIGICINCKESDINADNIVEGSDGIIECPQCGLYSHISEY